MSCLNFVVVPLCILFLFNVLLQWKVSTLYGENFIRAQPVMRAQPQGPKI